MIERKRIRIDPIAAIGMLWILVVLIGCWIVPLIAHVDPLSTDVAHAYSPPSPAHLLGTDGLGRDELARLLFGGRISVSVGVVAALVAMFIGTLYGALSAYYGGWLDAVLMRVVDVLLSVPTLFLLPRRWRRPS